MSGCHRPVAGHPEPRPGLEVQPPVTAPPCGSFTLPAGHAPREVRSLTRCKPPRCPDAGPGTSPHLLSDPDRPPSLPRPPPSRAAPLGSFWAGILHSKSGDGSSSGHLGRPGPSSQALCTRGGHSAARSWHRTLLLAAWVVVARGPHDPQQLPAHVCGVPGGLSTRDGRGIPDPAPPAVAPLEHVRRPLPPPRHIRLLRPPRGLPTPRPTSPLLLLGPGPWQAGAHLSATQGDSAWHTG